MRIEAGKTHYFESFKIQLDVPSPPEKKKPSSVAVHESKHVVAALQNGTGVESVTIIPGDGYLGLTKLSKSDAVAALAPHATGESGTGHDVFIASQIGSAGAESAARGIINSHMEEVLAVAVALEENKTLFSGEIYRAIDEQKNPKLQEGILVVESLNGERKEKKVTVWSSTPYGNRTHDLDIENVAS